MNFIFLIFGILFGIVLTKSEVISWFRIHNMFLFNEAHMYLIIGAAVVVGRFRADTETNGCPFCERTIPEFQR